MFCYHNSKYGVNSFRFLREDSLWRRIYLISDKYLVFYFLSCTFYCFLYFIPWNFQVSIIPSAKVRLFLAYLSPENNTIQWIYSWRSPLCKPWNTVSAVLNHTLNGESFTNFQKADRQTEETLPFWAMFMPELYQFHTSHCVSLSFNFFLVKYSFSESPYSSPHMENLQIHWTLKIMYSAK